MKRILFALLLLPLWAHSAPLCYPLINPTLAYPPAAPMLYRDSNGVALAWWCKAGGKWGRYHYWFSYADAGAQYHDKINAAAVSIALASDPKAAADALVSQVNPAVTTCSQGDTATQAVCTASKAYFDTKAASLPVLESYAVKPNGTAPDRPVRRLENGVMYQINGRATVGQPCDISRPTAPSVGTDLWAEFDPAKPGVVAVCAKQ